MDRIHTLVNFRYQESQHDSKKDTCTSFTKLNTVSIEFWWFLGGHESNKILVADPHFSKSLDMASLL